MAELNEMKVEEKSEDFSGALQQLECNQDKLEQVLMESSPPPPPSYDQAAGSVVSQPMARPMVQQAGMMTNAVTVELSPSQVILNETPMPDNTPAIVFSCFIIWCCFWPLGLIAFCVALSVNDARTAQESHAKIHSSYYISVAGLVLGIVCLIAYAATHASGNA